MELKHVQKSFLILLVGIFFISGCIDQQPNDLSSEKIIFTLPAELLEATEGAAYSYSFCEPDSARSGATCGALAGATTNPIGGEPPYSFSVQFGSGFIPPGLALELNGLLGGTPTLPGKYTFGVCVKDRQEEVCKTTSLTVKSRLSSVKDTAALLAGTWSGSYSSTTKDGGGCTYNDGGTLRITVSVTGNSFSGSAFADGIELRRTSDCSFARTTSSSGTVSGTFIGGNVSGEFQFPIEETGTSPIYSWNATLSDSTLKGGKSTKDSLFTFTLTRQ